MSDIVEEVRKVIDSVRDLTDELDNFQSIARHIVPASGEIPELNGIDVYGEVLPLSGMVGGDHIIYVDFKRRYDLDARIRKAREAGRQEVVKNLEGCRTKAGIVVADVSGHQATDALLTAMLHQAFLLGAIYELDHYGRITPRLVENLNTRFYNSSSVSKFLTMIYGEISEDGTFRFLSAAHPMPVVFSRLHDRIVDISADLLMSFPPIGTLPSQEDIDRKANRSVLGFKEKYEINEITLMGSGDIMVLYTDGLSEHCRGDEDYFPEHLEAKLRQVKDRPAREVFQAIKEDLIQFSPPSDDISYVVIKRT